MRLVSAAAAVLAVLTAPPVLAADLIVMGGQSGAESLISCPPGQRITSITTGYGHWMDWVQPACAVRTPGMRGDAMAMARLGGSGGTVVATGDCTESGWLIGAESLIIPRVQMSPQGPPQDLLARLRPICQDYQGAKTLFATVPEAPDYNYALVRQECPPGQYVSGMRVFVQEATVRGIGLICSPQGG